MNAEELRVFEGLSEKLYGNATPEDRERAQSALKPFLEPEKIEILGHIQSALSNSDNPWALLLATSSLTKVVNTHWKIFSVQARAEMRMYLLNFLANKGVKMREMTVVKSVVALLCLVIKLSWLDTDHAGSSAKPKSMMQMSMLSSSPSSKSPLDTEKSPDEIHPILAQITKFLQASLLHCLLGLNILNQLVKDMNTKKSGNFSLAGHRKVAISFRDTCLLDIFRVSLSTLRQLLSKPVERGNYDEDLKSESMELALSCLSFDFLGTSPDESGTDSGIVHVPNSWRSMIEDPTTLSLFLDFYLLSAKTQSVLSYCLPALSCLVQLAAVKRSIFTKSDNRKQYVNSFVYIMITILKEQKGAIYQDSDNHHQFCRLMSRLVANYQLSQIMDTDHYLEWISMIATFTTNTLKAWDRAPHSSHYLLNLWSSLISSTPNLRLEARDSSMIKSLSPTVMEAYVTARLESSKQTSEGDWQMEELMTDTEMLTVELKSIPYIGRCDYHSSGSFVVRHFDPLAQAYQQLDSRNMQELEVLETQLAWLIYIMGAMVGGRLIVNSSDGYDDLDGELSSRIFRLMDISDERLLTKGPSSVSKNHCRLEVSLLFAVYQFRQLYTGDPTMSQNSKLYKKLTELLGIKDNAMLMHIIVKKVITNLKLWQSEDMIITKSLELFHELAIGYTSGKLLAKMEITTDILAHHHSDYFPFLATTTKGNRLLFYTTLSKLLFAESHVTKFDEFMQPFGQALSIFLNCKEEEFRSNEAKAKLIALLSDLRGIVSSSNRGTYKQIFDWFYPDVMPVFIRTAEIWYHSHEVSSQLLKFVAELVFSKSARINFPPSSPNGILLFRETSKILVAYGQRLLGFTPKEDPYVEKYKGIKYCMLILTRAMQGSYVNFGVFDLYGDPALKNALNIVLQLALSISFEELLQYPKLINSYYTLINTITQNHTTTIIELDTPVFVQIMLSIKEGLDSYAKNSNILCQCCDTLDHLAKYLVENKTKDNLTIRAFAQHTAKRGDIFPQILESLFKILLFNSTASQWALARPLLSLILLLPQAYLEIKNNLINSLSQSVGGSQDNLVMKKQFLSDTFDRFMTDVKDNLLPKNRDRFSQNLTALRNTIANLA